MKTPRNSFVIVLALALALAGPVLAQPELTFEGFSRCSPYPDVAEASYGIWGIMSPSSNIPSSLPFDFDNYQYTAYVHMTLSDFTPDPANQIKYYTFDDIPYEHPIFIIEDPIGGGTAANYASESTFIDGELLLAGTVNGGWEMMLSNPDGLGYTGSGIGHCYWFSGSWLSYLTDMGHPLDGWTFAGTWIAEPSASVTVPEGYDLVFNGRFSSPYDPTTNADATWGSVKTMFR